MMAMLGHALLLLLGIALVVAIGIPVFGIARTVWGR
jgi:hypothetical protein